MAKTNYTQFIWGFMEARVHDGVSGGYMHAVFKPAVQQGAEIWTSPPHIFTKIKLKYIVHVMHLIFVCNSHADHSPFCNFLQLYLIGVSPPLLLVSEGGFIVSSHIHRDPRP